MSKTAGTKKKRSMAAKNKENGYHELFELMVDKGASDLHLWVPSSPVLRINGVLTPLSQFAPATPEFVEKVFNGIVTPEQKNTFLEEQELDFSYSIPRLARLRVSALRQRGTISLAFRLVPYEVPSIDELEIPQICKKLVLKPRGLILVTGPTGCGKSTTLAAMINYLNDNDARTIITIEDPIEYLYTNKKCLIAQRDLGDDTKSFANALIHALRHDPDVIVIGEMRDAETISTAITAAETGHLVLGTLHTVDAIQSIHRIIDMFPHDQQQQIIMQLSQVLEAILSQALLPRIEGGRIAAFEIMIANSAIRKMIREQRIFELPRNMEFSTKEEGMKTLDQALAEVVRSGIVSPEKAMMKSSNPAKLEQLLPFRKGASSSQTLDEAKTLHNRV
jgi:twitching motility protein PilT